MTGPPVACSLDAGQLADRGEAWRRLLDGWCVARAREPGMVRLEFRPDPGVEQSVARLAELERECCPWFQSRISAQDRVVLEMRAGEEGLAVLASLFGVGDD